MKYLTGEKIAINYKMNTNVRLGNYLVEIPMLVANFAAKINDDCILSVDFFEKINLGGVFEFIFHQQNAVPRLAPVCLLRNKSKKE